MIIKPKLDGVKLDKPTSNWDKLISGYEEHKKLKNRVDFELFRSKFAILFSHDVHEQDSDAMDDLLNEWVQLIDPYSEVELCSHFGTPEQSVILRLPAMYTTVPTFNDTKIGGQGADILHNMLDRHTDNEHITRPIEVACQMFEILEATAFQQLIESGDADKFKTTMEEIKTSKLAEGAVDDVAVEGDLQWD